MSGEKYLSAKELSGELEKLGIRPAGYKEAMRIIKGCDESIGFTLRLSDALAFRKAETRHRWPRSAASGRAQPLTLL